MTSGLSDVVARFQADLEQEAADARNIVRRLSETDFLEASSGPRIRELERVLEGHAVQVLAIGKTLEAGEASALAAGWEKARGARRDAWDAVGSAIEALATSLEAEQRERELDRERLAQGLRGLARDADELHATRAELKARDESLAAVRSTLGARDASLALLQEEARKAQAQIAAAMKEVQELQAALGAARAEVGRLEAILGSDGHRLVTRLAERLASYPRLAAGIARMARLARGWVDRSSR